MRPSSGRTRSHSQAFQTEGPSLEYDDILAAIEDKRLFVGHVPKSTSQAELENIFGEFGALAECKQVLSGRSMGVAFVKYETWAAAYDAVSRCQESYVVQFAERVKGKGSEYAKGLDVSRIFVGQLPRDVTEADLEAKFNHCGVIESVNLLQSKREKTTQLKCGYITFRTWGEAMDAIEEMNDTCFNDGSTGMTVKLAQPKHWESAPNAGGNSIASAGTSNCDLVPWNAFRDFNSGKAFQDFYSGSGKGARESAGYPEAKRRRIVADSVTSDDIRDLVALYVEAVEEGASRRRCESLHEEVMEAMEQRRQEYVENQRSYVQREPGQIAHRRAAESQDDQTNDRLFIRGLAKGTTDDELYQIASQIDFETLHPEVLECRVLEGKGCGYLQFSPPEAAEEAMESLNGRVVENWNWPLIVEWAEAPRKISVGGSNHTEKVFGKYEERPSRKYRGGGTPEGKGGSTQKEIEAQGLDPTRLFIGRVGRADAEKCLRPMFERFGRLHEFNFIAGKGILYVAYGSYAEAQEAQRSTNAKAVAGSLKGGLNVNFSQRARSLSMHD